MRTNIVAVFHRLELVAGNGKPYRFTYDTRDEVVRYYDRSIILDPGDPGYGGSDHNGHPLCGPALDPSFFDADKPEALAGDTEEQDIDRASVRLVGVWIAHLNEYLGI